MKTQWFFAFEVPQDSEVINQGVGVCRLKQRWNFTSRLPGKGCKHHGKVLRCVSRQTEAKAGLRTSRQDFETNHVSSGRKSACHKMTIKHQKLTDLHSEVLKHSACSPGVDISNCRLYHNLKEHIKGRNILNEARTCGRVFCNRTNRICLECGR
jgi:hypothetical protein